MVAKMDSVEEKRPGRRKPRLCDSSTSAQGLRVVVKMSDDCIAKFRRKWRSKLEHSKCRAGGALLRRVSFLYGRLLPDGVDFEDIRGRRLGDISAPYRDADSRG